MLLQPPAQVATHARNALAERYAHDITLPEGVERIAHTLANGRHVDTADLAALIHAHPPSITATTTDGLPTPQTLAWTALGGGATLGWLAELGETWIPTPETQVSVKVGALQPITSSFTADVSAINRTAFDRVDGILLAALQAMIRRAGAKVVNLTRRENAQVADDVRVVTASHRLHYLTTHHPAIAAAITADESDLLADALEEFLPAINDAVESEQRRIVARLASELGRPFGDVWAEVQAQLAEDRERAVGLAQARLVTFAIAVLAEPPESVAEQTVAVLPPASITSDVLSVAGGNTPAPATTRIDRSAEVGSPVVQRTAEGRAVDVTGQPTGSTLFGPTMTDQLAANGVEHTIELEWRHDAPPTDFEPHNDLHGAIYTQEDIDSGDWPGAWDPNEFPYRSNLAPGDHIGCRCFEDVRVVLNVSAQPAVESPPEVAQQAA